jgi:hypothetical protein
VAAVQVLGEKRRDDERETVSLLLMFVSDAACVRLRCSFSDFIASGLNEFKAKADSAVQVELRLKPCRHPFVMGAYASGVNKQIGVKNLSAAEVAQRCAFLRDQTGRKSVKLHEQVSHVTSTQGLWTNKRVLNNQ